MSTSLFEIVGPIMVGPSSSHTAGMARIGMMASRIAGFMPSAITLRLSPTLSTTYRGHRTDASLVGGATGMSESDAGLRHAIERAEEKGIPVGIAFFPRGIWHPNTAQIEMTGPDGLEVKVKGVSIGGGSIIIDAIDEQPVTIEPECYHLVIWGNPDAVDDLEVCYAFRIQKAKTFAVLSFKSKPEEALAAKVAACSWCLRVRLVEPVLSYGATISEELRPTRCDELADICRRDDITLAELAQRYEEKRSGHSREEIRALMHRQLQVMKESIKHGVEDKNDMLYGLTGGEDGRKLMKLVDDGATVSGGLIPLATARALGVMEYNASMGCIVAAPTAGSAGIVPGCAITVQEKFGFMDDQIVDSLFVSALIGVVMSHREVSFSGSVGGCQGEVGVSSAIAAAGIASLFSDDPQVPLEAMAICLKNLLGLICDPIAGPIEVPCIKRNAVGVANAMISADMAKAGIASYIPPDQVIDALIDVEHRLPAELRCTTTGGLACAEKAVCLRARLEAELRRNAL